MKHKITTIIPTHNRADKITQAIDSIENSDYPRKKIEIIVVDDCSTDNTKEIVNKLIKKYKNIKYLKTKKNSGPATARNLGVRNSKGELIFFTDDDCIISKNLFRIYSEFLHKNKDVMGIGGRLVPSSNNIIAKIEKLKDRILKINNRNACIGRKLAVGFTCNMIYKKKVFSEIGYFDEKFRVPAGEDTEFKDRVTEKYDVAFLPVDVIHNQKYDLAYILAILFKQGLEEKPVKNKFLATGILLLKSPKLVRNIIRKTLSYRKNNS